MSRKKNSVSAKKILVETALRLFKEKGYENVKVDEICEKAGISRNTFYYHFKKKEELFDYYLIGPEIEASEFMLSMIDTNSYLEQFQKIFEIQLNQMMEYGPDVIAQVLKRNIDRKVHILTPAKIELHDVYHSLIRRAQETGEIKSSLSPEEFVEAVVYLAVGISTIWCSEDGAFNMIEKNRNIMNALLK